MRNSRLDRATMQDLGLYRVSPGVLGWLAELFFRPIFLFLIIYCVAFFSGFTHQYSTLIILSASFFNFCSSICFLISNVVEKNTNNADILYLRNYSKIFSVNLPITKDVGLLQSFVKAALRPPYDTISFFPPAGRDAQKQMQDKQLLLRRGLPNVFTVRTLDDASWKQAVSHLMMTARLVVVECYKMEDGFLWELEQLPKFVDPNNVILVSTEAEKYYAGEVNKYLSSEYSRVGKFEEVNIPVFSWDFGKGGNTKEFKRNLISTVRARAPYSDQFLQQRAIAMLGELIPRILQSVFDLLHWLSIFGAFILILTQYLSG